MEVAQEAAQVEAVTEISGSSCQTPETLATGNTELAASELPKLAHEVRSESKIRRKLLLERKLTPDFEIMRGVTLPSTLQKLGLLWRKCPLEMSVEAREKLWRTSKNIKEFDVFFSHTWRTPGRWKFLSLTLQLSWLHILGYWFFAVLVVESLFLMNILPPVGMPWEVTFNHLHCHIPMNPWGVLIAPSFSVIAFFAAPYVHPSREMCFLDVACINQVHKDMLERGIYGLGGFLKHSKKMEILWSPPYLSRLWCIFEMACYWTANPRGKITVKPLFVEATVVALWAGEWMVIGLWTFMKTVTVSLSLFVVFPVLIPVVLVLHSLRKNLRLKQLLFDEMSNFELEKAECCQDFDRKFVYESITEWYGGPQAFTEYVRGPLRKHLLSKDLEKARVPFKYSLILASVVVTLGCDSFASFLRTLVFEPDACRCSDGIEKQSVLIEFVLAYFVGAILGVFICWLTVMVHFALFLCDRWARPCGGRFVDYLQTCLVFLVWVVIAVGGVMCGSFAYRKGLWPATIWLAIVACLAWRCHGGFSYLAQVFRTHELDELDTHQEKRHTVNEEVA